MALVVRKIGLESWREAVARRASADGQASACLAAFDAACADGAPEHIAAYRALDAHGCLDRVLLPGDSQKEPDRAESDQIEPPGS
jgi:hypothetical protein